MANHSTSQSKNASNGKPAMARTMATISSSEQSFAIWELSRALKIDPTFECRILFDCNLEQLSTSGADDLIIHLERLKNAKPDDNNVLRFEPDQNKSE